MRGGNARNERHPAIPSGRRQGRGTARQAATIENKTLLMLKLDPDSVALQDGFSRDVRQIGHWGTGNLELTLRTTTDLERAKPLLDRSYSGD